MAYADLGETDMTKVGDHAWQGRVDEVPRDEYSAAAVLALCTLRKP